VLRVYGSFDLLSKRQVFQGVIESFCPHVFTCGSPSPDIESAVKHVLDVRKVEERQIRQGMITVKK
jgi:hypothetical protein